ncbi:MAG: 3-oxoacyl-[acyl-carrier-protein] reductase [Chloroflexi bacterium]|nr:3-oxoacyl-[acyl-carrier-protein] reductase [Chloroflexota bacterium]
MPMMHTGRVALVTGASRGIGRAIAEQLGRNGAGVVVNYRGNAEAAAAVVAAIEAKGGRAVALAADVGQPAEAEALVRQALAAFGRLDILVNNAGITRDQLLLRLSEADWDAVLDTNLKAAYVCTRAALRGMLRQRWGRIVNVSSVTGLVGNAGQANYSAAKAGLIGLTRATAREVAGRSVTVNAVAPGFIDTDMTRTLPDQIRQEALKQIPLGRFGTAEEVAATVDFLVSDAAAYVTGHVLTVDGGMVMH